MLARPETTALAYVAMFAAMVLTNVLNAPHVVLLAAVLPAAAWRAHSFWKCPAGTAALHAVPRATVLWALVVYLAALVVADAVQPDATVRMVRKTGQFAIEIAAFVTATALLVATGRRFFLLMMVGLAVVVAASALVNLAAFLPTFPDEDSALIVWRLTAVLGMPGYANSTNISITYGVVLVAALATLTGLARNRIETTLLAASSTVLALAALATQARGAAMGIACGLATLAATLSRRARITIAVGAVLLVATLAITPIGHDWVARGASYRPEVWQTFLAKAAESPLFGYGGHTDITVTIPSGVAIDQPHNLVLSAQVRGGLLAALAMVVMLAGGLFWSLRHVRTGGSAVPLCTLVTMTVSGMVDYNLLITQPTWPWLTFWLPIALAAGAEVAVRAGPEGAPASGTPQPTEADRRVVTDR